MPKANGLPKTERLTGRTAVSLLFQKGSSHSITCHPVRAVYRNNAMSCNRILVTVSKRHLRHAVDRNRVKRQLREAYRLNKHILHDLNIHLDIALIWLSEHHKDSQIVHTAIKNILDKIQMITCTQSVGQLQGC